jgi:four helix bundle protein
MTEPTSGGFRRLRVWQEALLLAMDSFRLADALPAQHTELAEQIRRAAGGVHACIAEGSTWRTKRDFLRYLGMARGSLAEVESHTELVRATSLAATPLTAAVLRRTPHVGRLLAALARSLRDPPRPSS